MWARFIWLKAGPCKHDNEHYGSVQLGEFFHPLSDYKLSQHSPAGLQLLQLPAAFSPLDQRLYRLQIQKTCQKLIVSQRLGYQGHLRINWKEAAEACL
jgi:hypothetical protein